MVGHLGRSVLTRGFPLHSTPITITQVSRFVFIGTILDPVLTFEQSVYHGRKPPTDYVIRPGIHTQLAFSLANELYITCRSLRWPYTRRPILSLSSQRINSTIPGYRFLSQACTVKIVHVSVVHSTLGITNVYLWGAHLVKLITLSLQNISFMG